MSIHADTGMTFEALIIRTAEREALAGQLGTIAAVPSDPHDFDAVKRAVCDGYKEFLISDPLWSFLSRPVTITTSADGTSPESIAGDAGRYRLPLYVQDRSCGNWGFADQSSPSRECVLIHHKDLRDMRQGAASTGSPGWCSVVPIQSTQGAAVKDRGWEVQFYPTPGAAYTLTADFMLRDHKLEELSDKHIAGSNHDLTIIAFAVAQLNVAKGGERDRMLGLSKQLDGPNRSENVNRWHEPSSRRRNSRMFANPQVSGNSSPTTFDGVAIA